MNDKGNGEYDCPENLPLLSVTACGNSVRRYEILLTLSLLPSL